MSDIERQPMPKILAIHSTVMTCASCGTWYNRLPQYLSDNSDFDQCERCGCTSFKIRRGRPYGPKSKEWSRLIEELAELWQYVSIYEYECFVTDPPLPNAWEGVTWEIEDQS